MIDVLLGDDYDWSKDLETNHNILETTLEIKEDITASFDHERKMHGNPKVRFALARSALVLVLCDTFDFLYLDPFP